MANGMFLPAAQRAIQQEGMQQAMNVAQLGAGRAPVYYGALAGQQLGSALGGLFGLEDPRLTQARQMEEAMTGIDVSTPQGLRQLAAKRFQFGDIEGTLNTIKVASAMEEAGKAGEAPSAVREKMYMAEAIRQNLLRDAEREGKDPNTVPSTTEIFNKILPEQIYQGGIAQIGSSVKSEWLQETAPKTQATVNVNGNMTTSTVSDTYGKLGGLDSEITRLRQQQRFIEIGDPRYGSVQKRIEDLTKEKDGITGKIEYANQEFAKMFGNRQDVNSLRGRLSKIQETNQLLEGARLGNEASVKQLNEALSDLQGAHKSSDAAVARTSTAVSIGSKLADFTTKALVGTPSEGQIKDIRSMLKDMEDLYRREAEGKISSARQQFKGRVPSDILNQVYNMDYVGFRDPIVVDQPVAKQPLSVPVGDMTQQELSTFVVGEPYQYGGKVYTFRGFDADGNATFED